MGLACPSFSRAERQAIPAASLAVHSHQPELGSPQGFYQHRRVYRFAHARPGEPDWRQELRELLAFPSILSSSGRDRLVHDGPHLP